MDPEDVPAALRPLASSSARQVPVPLVARALEELERSGWLRAEALEACELEEEPAGAPALFLMRPEGWEERLADLVEEAGARRLQGQAATEAARQAKDKAEATRLRRAVKRAEQDAAATTAAAEQRWSAKLERLEEPRRRALAELAEVRRSNTALRATVADLEDRLAGSQRRVEALRARLERQSRPVVSTATGEEVGWPPADAGDLADRLDRTVAAARRGPIHQAVGPGGTEPLRLPGGTRPDTGEAVRWLLGRRADWLVDGHNVAFQLAGGHPPAGTTRARLVAAMATLRSLAPRGTAVTVVFDSSVDQASLTGTGRVRLEFVPSADDWITARARPATVVVTSDRQVRELSEQAGALGIWSEAIVEWIDSL